MAEATDAQQADDSDRMQREDQQRLLYRLLGVRNDLLAALNDAPITMFYNLIPAITLIEAEAMRTWHVIELDHPWVRRQ